MLVRCFIDSSIREESNKGNIVTNKNEEPGIYTVTSNEDKTMTDIDTTLACVTLPSNPRATTDHL
jgi:hypothetical protein